MWRESLCMWGITMYLLPSEQVGNYLWLSRAWHYVYYQVWFKDCLSTLASTWLGNMGIVYLSDTKNVLLPFVCHQKSILVFSWAWKWQCSLTPSKSDTVGILSMHRSNSVSKLTIILRQLTHRYILMLRPWHRCSTNCHRKLSIGRHNRLCSLTKHSYHM